MIRGAAAFLLLELALGLLPGQPAKAQSPALASAPAPALTLQQALLAALAQNANVQIVDAALELQRGALQQQAGAFNPLLSAQTSANRTVRPLRADEQALALQSGAALSRQRSDSLGAQSSLGVLLDNGWQASVSASQTRLQDNTLAAAGVPRQSSAVVSFQLRVPLLRNAGSATSTPLRAAAVEAEAAQHELEFTAAQTVLATALAYWDLAARAERLAINQAHEQRGVDLLAELRKLVAADERPRADLPLAEASLAEKRSSRIAAEQAVLEARRSLGRLMGVAALAQMAAGGLADKTPIYRGEPLNAAQLASLTSAQAQSQRADLLALQRREEAAGLRVSAARINEGPQLDAVLGATQNGLAEGNAGVASAFTRSSGPGYNIALAFQLPLGNDAARGLTRQLAAQAQSQQVRRRELGELIANTVETSAFALQRAAEQLREADKAVASYAASLDSELVKRRLGLATLIDVLNVEDRYNNALLAAVQVRQAYASAIAQFRFEIGALIARDGGQYSARIDGLFSPLMAPAAP